jgi:hypothetical protein
MVDEISKTAEAVKGIVEAVPVYEDLIQPAARELGQGLQTVAKTIHIALAPISALVWGYEKIKAYIQPALEERLKNVPPDRIILPDPAVAGPALEALRYTGYKEDLRELYANLLATSMDIETAFNAHPAFVDILKQLSPDEAKILTQFRDRIPVPLVSIRTYDDKNYYSTILHNHSLIAEQAGCIVPSLVTSYIENLTRLGLTEISYDSHSIDPGAYDDLMVHPVVTSTTSMIEKAGKRSVIKKGVLERTNLGKQFYMACVARKS